MSSGPGATVVATVRLSLAEVYSGVTKDVRYNRAVRCPACDLTSSRLPCGPCNGTGYTRRRPCPNCDGVGFLQVLHRAHACDVCQNKGLVEEEATESVTFEPGTERGDLIEVKGRGSESMHPSGRTGDLHVVAREERAAKTTPGAPTRNLDDLHLTIPLTVDQALFGFDLELRHYDGHIVTISSPTRSKPTQPGTTMTIQNEGFPSLAATKSQRSRGTGDTRTVYGDMVVTFQLRLPETLQGVNEDAVRAALAGAKAVPLPHLSKLKADTDKKRNQNVSQPGTPTKRKIKRAKKKDEAK